jgi:hypothetical protein
MAPRLAINTALNIYSPWRVVPLVFRNRVVHAALIFVSRAG